MITAPLPFANERVERLIVTNPQYFDFLPPYQEAPMALALQLVLSCVALFVLFTILLRYFARVKHPATAPLRTIKNLLLPSLLMLFVFSVVFRIPPSSSLFKIFETFVLLVAIWIAPSLLKAMFFAQSGQDSWRARVPELFLDILRFALIAVGVSLVLAGVWGRDMAGFFATLGVGSIVLGLALQDTLGNLMAGIALLFERPFAIGQWLQVGETVGCVSEMNWRAVHLVTLSNDLIIVPNSVLSKEKLKNYSRPSPEHRVEMPVGFSYNDPPNKVKRVILKVLESTRGVLPMKISVHTRSYSDSAIIYEVRFYIDEYERMTEIQEEFLTQLWYAVRRNGLTIPFPTRTIYKTELPLAPTVDFTTEITQALRSIEIFRPLSEDEMDLLSRDAIVQDFARGERIVYQGEEGDALYLIRSGEARVSVQADSGAEQNVARLGAGKFFGEMALLTGETRSAHVTAVDDIEVIVIYKDSLQRLLASRPELAEVIAEIVESRKSTLNEAQEQLTNSNETPTTTIRRNELLERMKKFFHL